MNYVCYKSLVDGKAVWVVEPTKQGGTGIEKSTHTSKTKALHSFAKRLTNAEQFYVIIPETK